MSPVLLAEAPQSAPVTHLMARLVLTAVVVVVVGLAVVGMRRGWRRRAARQAHLPAPPAPPAVAGEPLAGPAEGVYVSTTTAGDWLDRVVVHGLGVRSEATVTVHPEGVAVARAGAPDVFVPAVALRAVRTDRGMAGKFVEEDGLVVLTWELGTTPVDTGFRPRYASDRDVLVGALGTLLSGQRS